MNLTKEQIQEAMACKTADELLALTKSWGVELTLEQAEEYLAKMKANELTEEELAQVAGGLISCWINCPDFTCPPKFCREVAETCTYCGHCRDYQDDLGTCAVRD